VPAGGLAPARCTDRQSTDGIDYYLIDAWAGQPEYVDLEQKVQDYFERHKAREMSIEDKASGCALISTLKHKTRIPIVGVPALGSKEARAEAVTPLFYAGKVVLPESAPWLDEWIEEHVRFPAKPNDLADTTSIALERLSGTPQAGWSKVSTTRPSWR